MSEWTDDEIRAYRRVRIAEVLLNVLLAAVGVAIMAGAIGR